MRLNTYARLPQTVDVNGIPYCVWEGIEPRHAGEAKGLGLFATRQLPKGYCIPYGGVWRPESERVSVAKHPDRYYPRENAYFLKYRRPLPAERGERKKTELGVLDTHPIRAYQLGLPFFCWPGGLVNSRNPGEPRNCALEYKPMTQGRAPRYNHFEANPIYVETTRVVEAEEELVMDYHYSDQVQKRRGFGPRSTPCGGPKSQKVEKLPKPKDYDIGERKSTRCRLGKREDEIIGSAK